MRREGSASAVFARWLGRRTRVMQGELQLLTGHVLHVDRLEFDGRALRVGCRTGEADDYTGR
jgi:hypothetical protein